MAIRVALRHVTSYQYDRPVRLGPQLIRLKPAPHTRTSIRAYSLKVLPTDHFINWQQDPQSNFLARVVFPEPIRQFKVEVELIADLTVINPFDFFIEPAAERYPFVYEDWLAAELAPYLQKSPTGEAFNQHLAGIDRTPRQTVAFLVDLNRGVQQAVSYVIRLEPGVQTPDQTLALGSGSCRDSAWLMVQLLRHLGIAARFVSGYLIQLKPDVKPLDGPGGAAEDFCDLHAWCEAYIPGAGWIGLDPTSGLLAGEGHLPLAATPDPRGAAPIEGGLEACQVDFVHQMSITRVHEDPRVTLPYTDAQWARIDALGHEVDRLLRDMDVRLTMGGEPTFISIDDMDGPEWNTAAVGPAKRCLSERLIRRLKARFAPGGVLHFGQGKWYPGEQLPRWALACYWRADGHPIWRDDRWLADAPAEPPTPQSQAATASGKTGYGLEDARRFTAALTARLEVPLRYAVPAFEDPVHFLAREGRLPINVTPEDSRLRDPQERDRLRRVFERGLDAPVGYVLPLQRAWNVDRWMWQSGLWLLRGRHLLLIPGDSPIGLRLPLPSLPWVSASEYPHVVAVDPQAPREPLPVPPRRQSPLPLPPENVDALVARMLEATGLPDDAAAEPGQPAVGESASWVVRTALCVEPRDGRLHVFLPPLRRVEDWLELVAAIEDTAAALQLPVVLEGEPPPPDHRLRHIKVTPDPGVIEVNIHPAHTWDELVENTTALYEEARLCRLGTEKFMLDGRHTGTGGGNHVVLGGSSPPDSPLLRRPDLLRSLVAYWLNHPSLSYLFSGLFIGPTSQAPRVDEARSDSLYELEIAFDEIDRQLQQHRHCPPWLVDRIFRHLLTDLTGNTHRAEFCIDKLYSPDASSGRLGLVEFRGFEMPPHARMSLTQQLLLRTLIARFWRHPYTQRPVRWGTMLHDRFLLPHFVWRDFSTVIDELNREGFPLALDWFAPHFEFRFPVAGVVTYDGITLELRNAIEPWLVLGEEPGAGGTVRYVDSSVERLQVKCSNLVSDRYAITCNGRRLPLAPGGDAGQFVAGVRYRAWQPPSCLHPTLGVDSPLVFDLVDAWNGRSVGGCTYHVAHPAGRNYTTFPVNAFEAEARRVARFQPYGHTPGPMPVPPLEVNPEFPTTLDLRRHRR